MKNLHSLSMHFQTTTRFSFMIDQRIINQIQKNMIIPILTLIILILILIINQIYPKSLNMTSSMHPKSSIDPLTLLNHPASKAKSIINISDHLGKK